MELDSEWEIVDLLGFSHAKHLSVPMSKDKPAAPGLPASGKSSLNLDLTGDCEGTLVVSMVEGANSGAGDSKDVVDRPRKAADS